MGNYNSFVVRLTKHEQPHDWQKELAEQGIGNRLIHIPTGLGKTQGVLAAWICNRVVHNGMIVGCSAGIDEDGGSGSGSPWSGKRKMTMVKNIRSRITF